MFLARDALSSARQSGLARSGVSEMGSTHLRTCVILGLTVTMGCRSGEPVIRAGDDGGPRAFRASDANRGEEPYSAWFGDSDGRVLYFGVSPFWHLWWESGGNARLDLEEPGDHLIGRFDLEKERFLAPLVVRRAGGDSRSSVWDVLAHSNGRIYYTTYFEEMGSVRPDGSDIRHFPGLGFGLNEIVEGPDGRLYVTRYAPGGSIVVLTPEGELLEEIPIGAGLEVLAAPKSLAVDPGTGEIWCNADLFADEKVTGFASFRIARDGTTTRRAPPELHFITFEEDGTGWLAEVEGRELRLRVVRRGSEVARTSLGRSRGVDFVQDIKPVRPGQVVLALWSGRAFVATLDGRSLTAAEVHFQRPADCVPPEGRSVLYSAFAHGRHLYATLYCGWTILRSPLPGVLR